MSIAMPIFKLEQGVKDEVLVLPFGLNQTVDEGMSFEFSPADAEAVLAFFKSRGLDFQFDWEHQSIAHLPGFEMFKAPDGRAPAAGWSTQLAASDKGIVAKNIRWTQDAADAIGAGTYRYQSPVILLDKQKRVRAIQSAALTNEPRLKNIPALAARCDLGELLLSFEKEHVMLTQEVAGALGVKSDATDREVLDAVTALKNKAVAGDTAAGQLNAFKTQADSSAAKAAELETQMTALKSTHIAEVTALKAAHGTDFAALKATHATEIAAFKSTGEKTSAALAQQIADRLEETGRIATADKAAILEQARTAPDAVLLAFKAVKVGAVVPIGKLGIEQSPEAATTLASPSDHVSRSKAFSASDASRQQLHVMACKYADTHKVTYQDAVVAVSEAAAGK